MSTGETIEPTCGEPIPSGEAKPANTRKGRPRGSSPYAPIFEKALALSPDQVLPVALMAGDQEKPPGEAIDLVRAALKRAVRRQEKDSEHPSELRGLRVFIGEDRKVYIRQE